MTIKKENKIFARSENRNPAKKLTNFSMYLGVGSLDASSIFITITLFLQIIGVVFEIAWE